MSEIQEHNEFLLEQSDRLFENDDWEDIYIDDGEEMWPALEPLFASVAEVDNDGQISMLLRVA